ncbi:glucosidase II [Hypoxylon texense]
MANEPTTMGEASTNGMPTPTSTKNEASRPLELPSWVLNGCVKTLEELKSCEIPLRVYDTPSSKEAVKDVPAVTEAENTDHYEIHTATYESLFDLVAPPEESEDSINQRKFAYDAMGVRFPDEKLGQRFLELVIQHFAKDIGADILTLGLHDFENLAVHFATESGHTLPDGVTVFRDLYFVEPAKPSEKSTSDSDEKDKQDEPVSNDDAPNATEDKIRKKLSFPFETLFASISQKRGLSHATDQKQEERPIIVLLTEVQKDFYEAPRHILTHLREYVKDARAQGREIAVIAIDNQLDPVFDKYPYSRSPVDDDEFLSDLGSNPIKAVQVVLPNNNEAQKNLLESDRKKTAQKSNFGKLQDSVRARRADRSFSGLLEPYVDWKLSETSFAAKRLREGIFGNRELELLAAALSSTNLDVANIEKVFERFRVLNEWMVKKEEDKKKPGRWDNLHEGARKAIQKVEDDPGQYEYESRLLDSIVSSDAVDQSWNDIELDEETKDTVKQLVDLASSDPKSQYGLLSKSRIRGALLYGPPGTGKTQLARVLAHEYQAVMIHVSAAELESKYVGESEKQIKGLFNLASMVAPSIIFMDEADAMFRKRGPHDRSWERTRLNELLNQQDGLTAAKMPPFLLLATNHPNDLDDAVMRRVPARLYIGLPSSAAREKIFNIFLRDETLDPDLKLQQLAARTAGCTGSDIKTICTQAALICQNELDRSDKSSETRVLTEQHFDAAVARTGLTVSDGAVQQIRDFAKKFDPTALPKMNRIDAAQVESERLPDDVPSMGRGLSGDIWEEFDRVKGQERPKLNGFLDRFRNPPMDANFNEELSKFKQHTSRT